MSLSLRPLGQVAVDLLREAARRRWFLGLAFAVSATLLALALSLQMDVVDGALAATRLFGRDLDTHIQSVDVALRPVFTATTFVIYYGGLVFGVVACADFGPSLLAPGRIEHLLSLPIQRWQLLFGTFLGVMALAFLGALYAAGGLTVLLGVKTGVWTWRPALAALLSGVAFAPLFACMLAVSLLARSAALCAAGGVTVLVLGIIAGNRDTVAAALSTGIVRETFLALSSVLPKLSSLGSLAAKLAGDTPLEAGSLFKALLGLVSWTLAVLCLAVWRFDEKDF